MSPCISSFNAIPIGNLYIARDSGRRTALQILCVDIVYTVQCEFVVSTIFLSGRFHIRFCTFCTSEMRIKYQLYNSFRRYLGRFVISWNVRYIFVKNIFGKMKVVFIFIFTWILVCKETYSTYLLVLISFFFFSKLNSNIQPKSPYWPCGQSDQKQFWGQQDNFFLI